MECFRDSRKWSVCRHTTIASCFHQSFLVFLGSIQTRDEDISALGQFSPIGVHNWYTGINSGPRYSNPNLLYKRVTVESTTLSVFRTRGVFVYEINQCAVEQKRGEQFSLLTSLHWPNVLSRNYLPLCKTIFPPPMGWLELLS